MRRVFTVIAIILVCAFVLSINTAQAQTQATNANDASRAAAQAAEPRISTLLAQARPARRSGFPLMPASRNLKVSGPAFTITPMLASGPNLPVLGSGTIGHLSKWTGLTSGNSFIGDSTIFEDKRGNVGIGTETPTSRLTVGGVIESLGGGFKFPDGTIQTTSASGALFGVAHDATLTGNGTSGSPLGVSVPLILSGSVGGSGSIIEARNTDEFGDVVRFFGAGAGRGVVVSLGSTNDHLGGVGVQAQGGSSGSSAGGVGVQAQGGSSNDGPGGIGVYGIGGPSNSGRGGPGLISTGGHSNSLFHDGGEGAISFGGDSDSGNGGLGVFAKGGTSMGGGKSSGIGIEAEGGSAFGGATPGLAGKFNGDVDVTGTLSKGGGSFKIDHPLDPENKYLFHSFVESPDMMNIYNGNIVTNENGEAVIELPDYFEALNRDFRYQLTVIGTFAQAIVADEVKGNRFVIRTNAPNVKVSWQVTGIRRDAWANRNRIQVEVEKPARERGFYLHPEAFKQPDEKGVEWARNPERMQQLKQQRIESKQKPDNQ